MGSGGSRSPEKGHRFEREICTRLSRWISRGLRDDLLWRSSMSGGRATVRAKRGLVTASQAGDISAIHELAQPFMDLFFVECKFYRDLQIQHSLISPKSSLRSFWGTAVEQAQRSGRMPILIAKENLFPVLVLVTEAGAMRLGLRRAAVQTMDLRLACLPWQLPSQGLVEMYLLSDLEKRRWQS